jgi:hypothetical protein
MGTVPYSLSELRTVSQSDHHAMDEYHRQLMHWAVARITVLEHEVTMTLSADSRLDLGTVLTSASGDRYLVIDAIGGKLRLVRIPTLMEPHDFGVRFRHRPEPGDPTRAALVGDDD